MDFGEAIKMLKAGKRVSRTGWNGKGIFLELQTPDEHSKMTQPYIYIDTTGLITDNPDAPKGRVPWLASQTDMLAEDWVEAGAVSTAKSDWDNVKHFARSEFACKCGKCGGYPVEPDMQLVSIADKLREELNTPIIVSSGVRCKTHNAAVGGVSTSRHMMGTAMDFCAKGVSANNLLARVKNIPGIVFAYAIDGSYVHMDTGNK